MFILVLMFKFLFKMDMVIMKATIKKMIGKSVVMGDCMSVAAGVRSTGGTTATTSGTTRKC